MKTFSASTIVGQPTASNRRQPVRQTRNNPARTASTAAQAQGAASAPAPDNERNPNPGFFPALTHYTDAISALPKEMIRHNTMLKEVDAKIYGPEAQLADLVNKVLETPPLHVSKPSNSQVGGLSNPKSNIPSAKEVGPQSDTSSQPMNPNASDPNYSRRVQFRDIRSTVLEMLATLDEKNHVINTAIDCLEKQTKRCDSSFPHIEDEISEEARLGSMTHWAYTDKTAEKKGMMAGERTRRAANNAAAIQEAEAALRSEARREALAARKPRNQHLDSDFDDIRVVVKKNQAGAKGRKPADTGLGNGVGLGIVNGGAPPNKRRKIEKPTTTTLGAERAMTSVYGSSTHVGRGAAGSAKDTPTNDAVGKKKGRGGAITNGTGRRRSVEYH